MLEFVSFPIKGVTPRAAVLFLHGLGDVGKSWESFFKLTYQQHKDILFIFPNAPTRRVTINNGYIMPAWYDILNLDFEMDSIMKEDVEGFQKSSKDIIELLTFVEQKGIQKHKIFLGGFSQGGALALYTTLKNPEFDNLGGLVLLSCYLPFSKTEFTPEIFGTNRKSKLPIFWGHGENDSLIRCDWGRFSIKRLNLLGYNEITSKFYPGMDHSACEQEIIDVNQFIKDRI